jgi:hypothetical protein
VDPDVELRRRLALLGEWLADEGNEFGFDAVVGASLLLRLPCDLLQVLNGLAQVRALCVDADRGVDVALVDAVRVRLDKVGLL